MAKEKILLVFGDAVLLDVISRAVLLPAGYEISTGTSPEHVIEQCKIMQPDVLIVESALPGQDSANIIRQVNQNFPAIPIILFAKEIDNEKVRAALQAGVIDILTPPVKSKIVLKTVEGALEKRDWLVEWARQEARLEEERDTQSLHRRLKELDTISKSRPHGDCQPGHRQHPGSCGGGSGRANQG
jgi:DNA-binding NtrC family response regulator